MMSQIQVVSIIIMLSVLNRYQSISIKKKPITLITFDVDGTLIHGSSKQAEASVHARAFMHAIGKVFGSQENWQEKFPSPPLVIPPEKYHGCTDGLIALNIAKYGFDIPSSKSFPLLSTVFQEMTQYVNKFDDADISKGIEPLPKVIETLTKMSKDSSLKGNFLCGLVTGNVEEIARKKMKATGIIQTNILSTASPDQKPGTDDCLSFLGGFGSDFCSGDIDDQTRIYKDRGEQIMIAIRRAKCIINTSTEYIARVVHVGDAPADCLALKYCYDKFAAEASSDSDIKEPVPVMSIIAVATGKFSAETLTNIVGTSEDGYEPYVLSKGIADPDFIALCGVSQTQSQTQQQVVQGVGLSPRM